MTGRLMLVPNLLGAVPPDAVLPARTLEIARGLAYWVVETPKAARAFLKSLAPARSISELSIEALGDKPPSTHLDALLAPARAGHDLGLVTDAGCPGVADPGALLVAAAHAARIDVVPLVGPSALLLALMASGMNGQRFLFHGYLPVPAGARGEALRALEADSRRQRCTQIFIETPYRNVAMLETIVAVLKPTTRLCVACDLTLPSASVVALPITGWRGRSLSPYAKRPAVFVLQAE